MAGRNLSKVSGFVQSWEYCPIKSYKPMTSSHTAGQNRPETSGRSIARSVKQLIATRSTSHHPLASPTAATVMDLCRLLGWPGAADAVGKCRLLATNKARPSSS